MSYKILGSRVLDIKSSGHPLSIIPLSALDNNLNYKMTNLLLSLRSKVRGLLWYLLICVNNLIVPWFERIRISTKTSVYGSDRVDSWFQYYIMKRRISQICTQLDCSELDNFKWPHTRFVLSDKWITKTKIWLHIWQTDTPLIDKRCQLVKPLWRDQTKIES